MTSVPSSPNPLLLFFRVHSGITARSFPWVSQAHFDDSLTRLQLTHDLREQRFQPCEKHAVGTVPDTKPHDRRRVGGVERLLNEIIILGDEHPTAFYREVSNAAVVGIAEAFLSDRGRGVALITEPARK